MRRKRRRLERHSLKPGNARSHRKRDEARSRFCPAASGGSRHYPVKQLVWDSWPPEL